MTKKKFISDYTERFWFYMLEWESDGNAVKKVLGEVYDKMKRPTKKSYYERCGMEFVRLAKEFRWMDISLPTSHIIMGIYKKYLSDSNGWDSADTVSKEESLWTYRGKDMRFDTEEWRQAIRDCIGNQEATIQHLQKNSFTL